MRPPLAHVLCLLALRGANAASQQLYLSELVVSSNAFDGKSTVSPMGAVASTTVHDCTGLKLRSCSSDACKERLTKLCGLV